MPPLAVKFTMCCWSQVLLQVSYLQWGYPRGQLHCLGVYFFYCLRHTTSYMLHDSSVLSGLPTTSLKLQLSKWLGSWQWYAQQFVPCWHVLWQPMANSSLLCDNYDKGHWHGVSGQTEWLLACVFWLLTDDSCAIVEAVAWLGVDGLVGLNRLSEQSMYMSKT